MITNATPNWTTQDEGETWHCRVDRLLNGHKVGSSILYVVTYQGRGRGGGPQRWRVQEYGSPLGVGCSHEFEHVHEAKAWVDAVVRLS